MPSSRFEPSSIKNKIKREEVSQKTKKEKRRKKLERRLEQAKREAADPAAKKRRLAQNVPRTLDNTREFDPSFLTANPSHEPTASSSKTTDPSTSSGANESTDAHLSESLLDISADPFAAYFNLDPNVPPAAPKILLTTSPKPTRVTYAFCEDLVSVFPGAEFVRRKAGKGFELGRIAGWAAGRGFSHMIVVNEDTKKLNAITVVHLPDGPTAYFKLTSVQLIKDILGHARPTPHHPELILNNFVTRLGHTVGRLFQTIFPPLPEFQGRQVVTLHNQRDFLFFRRHRYAFRSTDKAALQEIGPRFTLKLRWLKKGLPAVKALGQPAKGLEFAQEEDEEAEEAEEAGEKGEARNSDEVRQKGDADATMDSGDNDEEECDDEDIAAEARESEAPRKTVVPPTEDEYIWMWKPELETTRRTFFL